MVELRDMSRRYDALQFRDAIEWHSQWSIRWDVWRLAKPHNCNKRNEHFSSRLATDYMYTVTEQPTHADYFDAKKTSSKRKDIGSIHPGAYEFLPRKSSRFQSPRRQFSIDDEWNCNKIAHALMQNHDESGEPTTHILIRLIHSDVTRHWNASDSMRLRPLSLGHFCWIPFVINGHSDWCG